MRRISILVSIPNGMASLFRPPADRQGAATGVQFQSRTGWQASSDGILDPRIGTPPDGFNPERDGKPLQTTVTVIVVEHKDRLFQSRTGWQASSDLYKPLYSPCWDAMFQSRTGWQASSDFPWIIVVNDNLIVSIPNGMASLFRLEYDPYHEFWEKRFNPERDGKPLQTNRERAMSGGSLAFQSRTGWQASSD